MPAMDYSKVAELYDVYAQTEVDVPFFIAAAAGCRAVLELTSGTGRLSIPLLRAGVPLACLDSSPEMLAVLRRKLEAKGLTAPVYGVDAVSFSLPQAYDLAIIPFNSFAEITETADQRKALDCIAAHLVENGRLIVTLHNPALRLQAVDGQLRLRGRFALPGGQGALALLSAETYDPSARRVNGIQFYEIYTPEGRLVEKRSLDIHFSVLTREAFEALAGAAGYRVVALYGDYARGPFDPQNSPFMIWVLAKEPSSVGESR